MTSAAKRLRAGAQEVQARVDGARATVPGVDAALTIWGRDADVGGHVMSAAIAYRLFVWLLPFALLVAAFLGFLGAGGETDAADVAREVGLGGYVVSTVDDAARQAEGSRWLLLVLGAWGLYGASAAGAKTVTVVNALVWGLSERRPRNALKAAGAFAAVLTALLGVSLVAQVVRERSPGLGLAATLAIFGAYALAILGGFALLPHPGVPWTRLLPGAVFAAMGIQLLHLFTVYYLADRVSSSSELYGALGAAASILLWLYLMGRVVVAATLVNATLWSRVSPDGGDAAPGHRGDDRLAGDRDDREAPVATLTAWKFETVDGADRAEAVLLALAEQQLITLHDAAVVSWPAGRKGPRTRQLAESGRTGALGGAFWGLLFGVIFFVPFLGMAIGAATGALAGSLSDVGIDDDFIAAVRTRIVPGTSALFLLSSDAVVDKVHDALAGAQAELIQSNLPTDAEQRLREVFTGA